MPSVTNRRLALIAAASSRCPAHALAEGGTRVTLASSSRRTDLSPELAEHARLMSFVRSQARSGCGHRDRHHDASTLEPGQTRTIRVRIRDVREDPLLSSLTPRVVAGFGPTTRRRWNTRPGSPPSRPLDELTLWRRCRHRHALPVGERSGGHCAEWNAGPRRRPGPDFPNLRTVQRRPR